MNDHLSIAVVGMAGVFPGAATLEQFWQNIIHKKDICTDISLNRWIGKSSDRLSQQPLPDKAYHSRGYSIQDFHFNPDGFLIPASVLESLDPLYHLALHAGREAFGSFHSSDTDKDRIGVILAAIALPTDSSSRLAQEVMGRAFENTLLRQKITPLANLPRSQCIGGQVTAFPAEILALALGLGAGAFTLDAACASSLYSVKLACDALRSHRYDAVLAGGVSRPDSLYTQIGFSQLQALSASGRCAPFDACADGLLVGEGAGILVLKRLEDAQKDGDSILAVIRGIGLSNDMRGNLLAPDTEGQVRAMLMAYRCAGWDPSDVDIIECHGTGTPVGDGIELQSLKKIWRTAGSVPARCSIGSVKSMIGHLLTAAGAAGLIKMVLALRHQILPPTMNFQSPPENSPLNDHLFEVQTEPESWLRRQPHIPRRAAVSAFGFGGINAHILLEEWAGDTPSAGHPLICSISDAGRQAGSNSPLEIAIVGMDACFGRLQTLQSFQEAILSGKTDIHKRPENRWRNCDDRVRSLGLSDIPGGFIEQIEIELKDFHIPPNEIPDILIQHLLMLKVAGRAMADAGFSSRELRPRMGAIIGMGFDLEATNFHLRWMIDSCYEAWLHQSGRFLDATRKTRWLESLKDACAPPLTHSRTLGALAGIIASRITREFGMGAPSFTVSGNALSGMNALDIAARLLRQNEVDAMLVGAVDMSGDIRNIWMMHGIQPFSSSGILSPFDRSADGTLPGEGSAALVLKRLDQAVSDGNRIYAVIKGTGFASAGSLGEFSTASYSRSFRQSLAESGVSVSSVGLMETHGSGYPDEDSMEATALNLLFQEVKSSIAIGSVKPIIGHAGAAAGMASLLKASLCLYQEIISPLVNYSEAPDHLWNEKPFYFPVYPEYWARNRQDGPRIACCASVSQTGSCAHVILEGYEPPVKHGSETVCLSGATHGCNLLENIDIHDHQRSRPLGYHSAALFIIDGDSPDALLGGLKRLEHVVQESSRPVEETARRWLRQTPLNFDHPCAVSLIAETSQQLVEYIADAQRALITGTPQYMNGRSGVMYCPQSGNIRNRWTPSRIFSDSVHSGDIAFVFPGSGNHFVGMGRTLGTIWPEILRQMDMETSELKTQLVPDAYIPHRQSWTAGWEINAQHAISSDPLVPILGQVIYGSILTRIVKSFGISPQAVIGYSLGETAGLYALGAWPDRSVMLSRLMQSPLFRTELTGPCLAARRAWNIPVSAPFNWKVAAVNRSAEAVRAVLPGFSLARLLIVNTPDECVIAGDQPDIEGVISALNCEAVYLDGVVTVHCDAAVPVQEAYRELHRFPTTQPEGIRFYSCAWGRVLKLDTESAAGSITSQAISGFDFTATVLQAYQDGVRIFLEMGPHSSCTRMISRILNERPHLAISVSNRGEYELLSILKLLGTLAAERIFIDLDFLYGHQAEPAILNSDNRRFICKTGGLPFNPAFPELSEEPADSILSMSASVPPSLIPEDLFKGIIRNAEATADVHRDFLLFSQGLTQSFADALTLQTRLLQYRLTGLGNLDTVWASEGTAKDSAMDVSSLEGGKIQNFRCSNSSDAAYSRELCLEFAIGSAATVLGPEFAVVDTYPTRVRLPDEPLMLVDRIIAVEGAKGSLGSGWVITEHDVQPDAWYLDGGHAPVCISVEAGQADLFLCAYLGIDLQVKGQRSYRLLDASVQFHRGLPSPGDIIRYEIAIDRFVCQSDTWLFFFNFKGYISNELLITMNNGCAGFFTAQEVENSGGIILTEIELQPVSGRIQPDWKPLVPMTVESFTDSQVEALRSGNLSACFGDLFRGIAVSSSLCLPGGRMRLIDRVLTMDPSGGRYGLGTIHAQSDIHPDDWFLTCHFMDDPVMPGTLMYECCVHALRVFIQRMGWISEKSGVCYEPVTGIESILKCRGPVTPMTRKVIYQIDIRELGYAPEPYAVADALMIADDRPIVMFRNISLKMTGVTRFEIESFWQSRLLSVAADAGCRPHDDRDRGTNGDASMRHSLRFDRSQILSLCTGKPSDAFGEIFRPFDRDRFLARLPGPPYLFMDRVIKTEPPAFILKPDGWIEAEYDVSPSDWYFQADRSGIMPFAVLLEIALQPCGWLAAYAGSALTNSKDLRFRNLGGKAEIYQDVFPNSGTLTMRCRLTQTSSASDMIIESFEFQVLSGNKMVYDGETIFGFFTDTVLAQQKGIRGIDMNTYRTGMDNGVFWEKLFLPDTPPFTPDGAAGSNQASPLMVMPAKALRMIDMVTCYAATGGPRKLGYIRGSKIVDPKEWFFKAHFYQDPVWPGSLGIEALMQLMKFIALDKWPELVSGHRFSLVTGEKHTWTYRGQVIPENHMVDVDAAIIRQEVLPNPLILADSFLSVDGLPIYEMKGFGLRLAPLRSAYES